MFLMHHRFLKRMHYFTLLYKSWHVSLDVSKGSISWFWKRIEITYRVVIVKRWLVRLDWGHLLWFLPCLINFRIWITWDWWFITMKLKVMISIETQEFGSLIILQLIHTIFSLFLSTLLKHLTKFLLRLLFLINKFIFILRYVFELTWWLLILIQI